MQSGRELGAQVRLTNGKALAIGGVDNNGNLLDSAEVNSPTPGTWALTGSMAEAREAFPAVVLTDGRVLVSGGFGAGNTVLATAELYDPTTGAWSPASSLSVARFGHSATLLGNGKVLVTGGCTANLCSTVTATSEIYDPGSNTWSTTGSLNTARYNHSAVKLKTGQVLVIGGNGGGTSCELYHPTNGAWTPAASISTIRNDSTATLLRDGKVLVTGGTASRFPIVSAEIYNPSANTWTVTGNMVSARYAHAAALLGDGTVLVAGGEGQPISCGKACTGYVPFAKAEIYNETTGKFAATAPLSRAEAYHSMTLLGSGRALANGGIGTTATCCVVVASAQVYTPLTLAFSASSFNFGVLQIGLTSPSQTVTVTNVSGHSANFTSIASSGDYSQTNTCAAILTAGQNCSITVTFTPTAAGARKGAVVLKDNAPGSSSQTIALSGTGEVLSLGFTPTSLNLGSVQVGFSSTQSTTLTNDGAAPVNITGVSVTPANGTFTQTNNCPATLEVQQTCTFQIVFTPPDVFTYNATVAVTNNAGGAASLAVTGTGLDGGDSGSVR